MNDYFQKERVIFYVRKKEIKLTAAGFTEIEEELAKLREEDRPRIIQAIKEARAQGDLSENADYDAAREEQAKTESRIKELEYMLEHATIVKEAKKASVDWGLLLQLNMLMMKIQMNIRLLAHLKLIS